MSCKFYALNQILKANIFSSTENNLFPLSNLKDPRRTKVFRTTENSGWVTFDFGEAIEIDSFFIVDPKHREFNIKDLRFMANMTDAWDFPEVDEPVSIDYPNGVAYLDLSAPVFARYVRLEFESDDDFCELSKLFVGKKTLVQGEPTYPVNFKQVNRAEIRENLIGQKFIDEIATQKVMKLNFETLDENEIEGILELMDFCSTTIPLFVAIEIKNITETNRLSGYYYFSEENELEYIVGNFWNTQIALSEGM